MKYLNILLLVITLASCSDQMKKHDYISYKANGLNCQDSAKKYWLMDMVNRTENDSVIFSTLNMGRKLELDMDLVNRASSLFQLLAKVCDGDSIYLELPADSFYSAMNGSGPNKLSGQNVKLNIHMHDKLSDIQYQAHKQAFEQRSIEKYVKKFGWNAQYDSTTGIFYEKLKTSRTANSEFKVGKFKYLLKTITDEPIAYSKDEEPLLLDTEDDTVLKGLRFAAGRLNEGESIRAIIPSNMAYGPEGNAKIPPYFPIIVELEMLEKVE